VQKSVYYARPNLFSIAGANNKLKRPQIAQKRGSTFLPSTAVKRSENIRSPNQTNQDEKCNKQTCDEKLAGHSLSNLFSATDLASASDPGKRCLAEDDHSRSDKPLERFDHSGY
jgi:hypothetical protein